MLYVQTVDRDNPWIALRKPWIHALRNNPWIVCANCGSVLCATQSQAPQTKLRDRTQSQKGTAIGHARRC